jgi:hypothetical protein
MCDYKAKFLVGRPMGVQATVGVVSSDVKVDSNYGDILGVSIGETYDRASLGRINLSLRVDSTEKIVNVPLNQFLPDGERHMWPINIPAGTNMTATLGINVAGLDPARPIPLIFHTEGIKKC